MPTIFTHAIVPLAAGLALGRARISTPMLITGIALSMVPDADVVGFKFGIEYANVWGHRGASHALLFAGVVAAGITAIFRPDNWKLVFAFLFIAMTSHGLLDTLTNGGLGAALFWPFDNDRYFAPATPIRVSPLGLGFFSMRGIAVILSEIVWVWLPALLLAVMLRLSLAKPKGRT